MKITLKDGSVKEVDKGVRAIDVIRGISEGLARVTLAVGIDGSVFDASTVLEHDCSLVAYTFADEQGREAYRHTTSHVMAQAVKRLYPSVKLAIGPAIDKGFYYDFDTDEPFSTEDFPKIEAEMQKIVDADYKLERFELPRAEAIALMEKQGEPYKVELIGDLPEDAALSFYRQGEYTDLCAGPHVASTGMIKAFKLMSLAGAYWRGSEKNKMLQRIYGTSFEKRKDLDEYVAAIEQAKERDHRKLGRELDLFSVDDYVGPGLVLWHPKLSVVREQIELYWRQQHRKHGYEYVYTPQIGKSQLWETSGHLTTFKEGMYPPMSMALKDEDEQFDYYVKPMNCPFHFRIYKSRPRSYKELPIRYCELGNVYRFEKSGTLHGMLRVRGFTQDDAHIICRDDQFVAEVNGIIDFALELNATMGFDNLKYYLSVRDPEDTSKYIGKDEIWRLAEKTLREILDSRGVKYEVDVGGAKFYGPSVDLKAVDAMGREWQGTTIQLDMNLSARCGLTYIGEDGREHEPILLHRTLLGSMERFVGTLIEHYGGAFPVWLSPTQVSILTITNRVDDYANKLAGRLRDGDVRADVDNRNEKIGFKIREAQVEKVPYMLVVGDKEAEAGTVSVRQRGKGDIGAISFDDFEAMVLKDIKTRAIW
jgi:threonyl-tRNA synthetase